MSHLPLIYRNDGFSLFGLPDPLLDSATLFERFVDPLSGEQWAMMREFDRRVHANVMALVRSGVDPLCPGGRNR